jgi:hypothetical protein
MATKSHILNDFQNTGLATYYEIHKKFEYRRFLLHKSSIWQGEYDISQESRYQKDRSLESLHLMMQRLSWNSVHYLPWLLPTDRVHH